MHLRNSWGRSASSWLIRQGAVRGIRFTRLELADSLLDFEVPGHIRNQIADQREGLHRFDLDGLIEGNLIETRHAHQARDTVDLGRAGPAFARFAVPAHGKIARLFRLDLMNGVEHDHPLRYRSFVILESARSPIAAPDLKRSRCHYFISSIICFISSVIGGSGSRVIDMDPSGARLITRLNFAASSLLSG